MDKYEKISYIRCLEILNKYKICIVTYKKNNLNEYIKLAQKYKINILTEFFDFKNFKSIQSYNNFMLSINFYKRFKEFEYILIYQLDAYVFRDELEEWCKKKYSYIGAPIFKGGRKCDKNSEYMQCMNGGLSLRNTKDMINILSDIRKIYIFENKYERQNLISKIKAIIKILTIKNDYDLEIANNYHEDILLSKIFIEKINNFKSRPKFWDKVIKIRTNIYNLPSFNESYKFSFEENIEYLSTLYNNSLPTFCHAFQLEYKRTFWNKHITL